jgi:hypothetical protein
MADQSDLLERYLQSVGRYLPAEGKEDTLAELRANLLAEMDDKAEELGRALTEVEEAEVLQRHGHPSVVAARYRPRRSLIGPELFPYYWLTMRRALPFVVAIVVVSRAVELIYGPAQTAVVMNSIARLFSVVFYFCAWMTLVFAAAELIRARYPQKVTIHAGWDPRKLAKVEPKEKSDLPKYPVFDLICSAVFTAWFLSLPRFPFLVFGPGAWYLDKLYIAPAPVWHSFYWVVVALSCLQLLLKAIALLAAAQRWRKSMKVLEQLGGLVALVILLRAHEYVVLTRPVLDAKRVEFAGILNLGIHRSLEMVLVIVVLKLMWDVWQVWSETTRHEAVTAINHGR